MSRTLYLARHGETDWNRENRWQGQSDIGLNDTGRAQAKQLAEALAPHGIAGVCASDLSRARETADIAASTLGLGAVAIDAGLRERCFGVFEGLTRDECNARYPDDWQRYLSELKVSPPGAELPSVVAARFSAALLRLANLDGARHSLLIVSHGGAMRSFLHAITGCLPPPLSNGATFRVRLDGSSFSDVGRVR
jgi:broad specificity phosphatase PhoE